VASLEVGDRIQVRSRDPLMETATVELGGASASFDVGVDDDRFLMILEAGGSNPGASRVLVTNVFEELDRLNRGRN
jgi:hypothetical protein